ncbi:hypothetical protein PAPYR_5278 [Paratrimastix pyriformis]|uniref:Uncharacterized protein n=1 Tax=Paratrimastix pyriformis TaxID=342808 RepID=A0ABQ8UHR1_9EUKA|nr:hypothetical protein PAPYR_5278 [Paratrimastix pyriformis]
MVNLPLVHEESIQKDTTSPTEVIIGKFMATSVAETEIPSLLFSLALRARDLPEAQKISAAGVVSKVIETLNRYRTSAEICWGATLLLGFMIEHTEVGTSIVETVPELLQLICELLIAHHGHPNALIACCAAFTFIICYENPRTQFPALPLHREVIATVMRCFTEYEAEQRVLSALSLVILNMCMVEPLMIYMHSQGVVPKLAEALRRYPDNTDLANHACRALGNISSAHEEAAAQMADLQLPRLMVDLLRAHLGDPELALAVLRGLRGNSMQDGMGLADMGMIGLVLDLIQRHSTEGKHLVHLAVRTLLKLINGLPHVRALFTHRFSAPAPKPTVDDSDIAAALGASATSTATAATAATAAAKAPKRPEAAAGSGGAGSGAGGSGRAGAAAVGGDFIAELDFPTLVSSVFVLYSDEEILVTEAARLCCVVLQMLAECFLASQEEESPPAEGERMPMEGLEAAQFLVKMAEGGLVSCLVQAIREYGIENRTLLVLCGNCLHYLGVVDEIRDTVKEAIPQVLPVALYLRSRVRARQEHMARAGGAAEEHKEPKGHEAEAGEEDEAEDEEPEFDDTDDGTDEGYLALCRLLQNFMDLELDGLDERHFLAQMHALVDGIEGAGGEEAEEEEEEEHKGK